MALSNCLDCGYEVSDTARRCPKCGRVDPTTRTGIEIFIEVLKRIFKRFFSQEATQRRKNFAASTNKVSFTEERKESLDIIYQISVSYLDLINGCTNTYEINGKDYRVTIPKGSKVGNKLRLKGIGKQISLVIKY